MALLAGPSAAQEPASDSPPTVSELFEKATAATASGAFSEAIVLFEQLSDRGAAHPDTSFNRAIAYWQRAESPKRHPGDLGQAAAGFREAASLRSGMDDAERYLQLVHQEISRERSRQGLDPVIVQPPLGRAIVSLLPESVWAAVAALASLVLCVGLVLRRRAGAHLKLAGQINAAAGALLLLVFGTLTFAARSFRINSHEATVIVHQARLLDRTGKPLKAKALDVEFNAIPEGAGLLVQSQNGHLVQVLWGSTEAWVKSSDLRLLARPD